MNIAVLFDGAPHLRVGVLQGDQLKPGPGTIEGLTPAQAGPLLAKLATIPGTVTVPLYHPSQADDALPQPNEGPISGPGGQLVVQFGCLFHSECSGSAPWLYVLSRRRGEQDQQREEM